jgi:DNA-binding transcriptional regulator PaaX
MNKILALLLLPNLVMGQMKIFVTRDKTKAEVLVYKTKYFTEANLVIKKTWDIKDLSKKYHWYFVSSNNGADADWIVYYTDNIEEADHTVYFTDNLKLLGNFSAVCQPMTGIGLNRRAVRVSR